METVDSIVSGPIERATRALIESVQEHNPQWNYLECASWAIDGICEQYLLCESDERYLREMFEVQQ
jgi:hypothetical protein